MRRSSPVCRVVLVLLAMVGGALSMLDAAPAHADPATISGAIQFPAGTFPPDIEPDFPDIAVFDRGEDEIHYEVLGYHGSSSGMDADLSWDVASSQLRWVLVGPPESTYQFTVFWSRWVYTGPIPDQVDSKQFFLSSSSSSMATDMNQATVYPLGTSGLFHCASGSEGCAAGGFSNTPAVVPGAVAISGTPRIGERLTATPGTWQPAATQLAYQWLRDGSAIAGATATTYVVTAADAARKLSVRVTGSAAGHTTQSATTAPTPPVARGTLASATPKISGTAKVGKKLKARPGDWGPSGVTLSYQWYADGQRIAKATKAKYAVSAADQGAKIVVKVTGVLSGYTTITKASAAKKISA